MLTVAVGLVVAALIARLALLVARSYRLVLEERSRFDNVDENGIRANIQLFLRSGYDGAVMSLTDMNSPRFIQFQKYIESSGQLGLRAFFSKAGWLEPYFDATVALLNDRGISFERRDAEFGVPVVEIDFGVDADQAAAYAVGMFKNVFGCPTVSVAVRANDIDPRLGHVVRRDHPRPFDYLFGRTRHRLR